MSIIRSLVCLSAGICLGLLVLRAQQPVPASVEDIKQRIEKSRQDMKAVAERNPARVILTVVNTVTGQPAQGIPVTMTNFNTPVISDSNGIVEFNKVPPGTFTALVQGREVEAIHTVVQVREGATVRATMSYFPPGSITGTVTNELGEPVAGLTVTPLYRQQVIPDMLWAGRNARTDTVGRYRLENIEPGGYVLRLAPAPTLTPNQGESGYPVTYYPNGTRYDQALRVQVKVGIGTDNIDFRVRKSAYFHLRGSVSGVPKGADKPRIALHPCDPSPEQMGGTRAVYSPLDPEGVFDAPGVLPGDYCLVFRDGGAFPTSYASMRVTVADRDIDRLRLVAAPPFAVAGRIVMEKDVQATMPPSLSLSPATPFQLSNRGIPVDPKDGSFGHGDGLPEDHLLSIHPPQGTYLKSVQYGGQDVTAGPLRLAPGTPLTITLAGARGSLRGRVDFGSDDPRAGIEVTLSPVAPMAGMELDRYFTTKTTESGAFEFTGLGPGRYRVFAWKELTLYSRVPRFLDLLPASTVTVENTAASDIKIPITTPAQVEEAKARF